MEGGPSYEHSVENEPNSKSPEYLPTFTEVTPEEGVCGGYRVFVNVPDRIIDNGSATSTSEEDSYLITFDNNGSVIIFETHVIVELPPCDVRVEYGNETFLECNSGNRVRRGFGEEE